MEIEKAMFNSYQYHSTHEAMAGGQGRETRDQTQWIMRILIQCFEKKNLVSTSEPHYLENCRDHLVSETWFRIAVNDYELQQVKINRRQARMIHWRLSKHHWYPELQGKWMHTNCSPNWNGLHVMIEPLNEYNSSTPNVNTSVDINLNQSNGFATLETQISACVSIGNALIRVFNECPMTHRSDSCIRWRRVSGVQNAVWCQVKRTSVRQDRPQETLQIKHWL